VEKRKTHPPAARVSRFPTDAPLPDTGRMHDVDLYARLLGLDKPWKVSNVELKLEELEVHVYVEHGDHAWRCPECEAECPLYDHNQERTWRHLDTMQYVTLLHAMPPRVRCETHGVKTVRLPWADRKSRFTLLFERFAIELLLVTDVKAASRLLRLSWDQTWNIKSRAVERGLERKEKTPPRYIGIDEKAFGGGHASFMTVVCNLEHPRVEWMGDDRKAETARKYFDQFTDEALSRIEAVAMDMWRPFAKAVCEMLKSAEEKMVYDRFHVMREITRALDDTRKAEHRDLQRQGNDSLKSTKYLWLRNEENLSIESRKEFAALRHASLKTARAWAIKEMLRGLWTYRSPRHARAFWKRWYNWASHSKLPHVIKAARKLRKYEHRILNFFRHGITNSVAEALNGQIERIKRMAHGFRNRENFKIAVLFRLGGLDLYPATHGKLG
jgi:transposase